MTASAEVMTGPARGSSRAAALVLVLLMGAGSAQAHDVWLQPDRFAIEAGEVLTVRQLVGGRMPAVLARPDRARELGLMTDLTSSFLLATEEGSVDLLAASAAGARPVWEMPVERAGLVVIAMEHAPIYTEHTRDEFLDYLEHEGFPAEEFEPEMTGGAIEREAYLRTLKALVRVGVEAPGLAGVHARALGQPIELVPVGHSGLGRGDDLRVRLSLAGEPLAGETIKAFAAGNDGTTNVQRARTDANGVAVLRLEIAGRYLLRTVHMRRCAEPSAFDCADTDWESYWTALTFEVD